MSDRLAVFNHGPDRAARHAGRGLRAARPASSWPASSASPTCWSGTAAASRSGRRRSGCSAAASSRRPGSHVERGPDRGRRLPRHGHPLPGGAGRRRPAHRGPAEPGQRGGRGAAPRAAPPSGSPGGTSQTYEITGRPGGRAGAEQEEQSMRRWMPGGALLAAVSAAVLIAGCGSSGGSSAAAPASGSSGSGATAGLTPPQAGTAVPSSVGKGEGQLNLIAWEGYAQPQWVKPFEQATGCQVQRQVRRVLQRDGVADGQRRRRPVRPGLRVRATPTCGSSTAATSSRSTST